MDCAHEETPVHVRPDGTTTCCQAYTTIGMDDQVEYCKCCYRDVDGYLGAAVYATTTTIDLTNEVT